MAPQTTDLPRRNGAEHKDQNRNDYESPMSPYAEASDLLLSVMKETGPRSSFFDTARTPLIDFMTIGDLLQLSGYENDQPLFGTLLCMFDSLREGSLCMDMDEKNLAKRLQSFSDPESATVFAKAFLANLARNKYERMVSKNGDEYKPLVVLETKSRKLLYFQKYFVYESRLKSRIDRLLSKAAEEPVNEIGKERIGRLIDTVFSPGLSLKTSKDGVPIARDPVQELAMKLALSSGFCIVSGGPGTGKTSLMVNILRCLVRAGTEPSEIFLCAPTGRAAQSMSQAVYSGIETIDSPEEPDLALQKIRAATLHKTLRFKTRANDFHYNEHNPLPASAAVLDEASMVDVVMMEKFLRAIDLERTRLIFLGDKDQLPSVEAGAVFAEMIPRESKSEAFRKHLVVLETTYRSGRNLQELATRINAGECPPLSPVSLEQALDFENDEWGFIEAETAGQWKKDLMLWADSRLLDHPAETGSRVKATGTASKVSTLPDELSPETVRCLDYKTLIQIASSTPPEKLAKKGGPYFVLLDAIFNKAEASRILTLVKQGIFGAVEINRFMGSYLSARLKSPDRGAKGVFSGAIIIVARNDYSKELFNGDSGVVIRDPDGVYRAWFRRSDSHIGFSMDLLPAWDPAFALTVHKCQGSEFDDVLVVLPSDEDHKLLTREMIYTAATRAKKRVFVYGKPSAFKTALKRKIARESGLSLWG